jgi:peptidoglycan/xylan/chitin deacetylase (PgdA/CDA1 family)
LTAIYKILCYLLVWTGVSALVRWLKGRGNVTIVLYHAPSPEVFASHVRYLTSAYNIISMDDFLKARQNGNAGFTKYSLIITFDDGHRSNFGLLPVMRTLPAPPVIYLCSGIINSMRRFWFTLPGIDKASLKKMPNAQRLSTLNSKVGFANEKEYAEREALDIAELTEMKTFVDFQSHTKFHPLLSTCETEEADLEIRTSRTGLNKLLGKEIGHFAYPNGDYSERDVRLVGAAGYKSARTTDIGWNNLHSDLLRLKITGVSDHSDVTMLKAELTGIPGYLYNLMQGGVNKFTLSGKHTPEFNRQ